MADQTTFLIRVSARNRCPPRGARLLEAYTDARLPTAKEKRQANREGIKQLPFNLAKGAKRGAGEATNGSVLAGVGHLPIGGAAVGRLIGVVVGSVSGAVHDAKKGLGAARREAGRYGAVNEGFSIRADSVATSKNALSAIADCVTLRDDDGHVMVRISNRYLSDLITPGPLLTEDIQIDQRGFDEHGNRNIDATALLERMAERGRAEIARHVAVKAVPPEPSNAQSERCCWADHQGQNTSIYITADPDRAVMAAHQFFHVLEWALNRTHT